MDFLTELKMASTALYDGMGDHADYCSDLMNQAAELIAKLQDNYDSKSIALKAAKAMQQAETARADANEQDAERYRWLRDNLGNTVSHWFCTEGGEELDEQIDHAMRQM